MVAAAAASSCRRSRITNREHRIFVDRDDRLRIFHTYSKVTKSGLGVLVVCWWWLWGGVGWSGVGLPTCLQISTMIVKRFRPPRVGPTSTTPRPAIPEGGHDWGVTYSGSHNGAISSCFDHIAKQTCIGRAWIVVGIPAPLAKALVSTINTHIRRSRSASWQTY